MSRQYIGITLRLRMRTGEMVMAALHRPRAF